MKISKLSAALEQLDCAIRLHFENSSPVSVCTLTGAASRILTDLVELNSPGSSWDAKAQKAGGLTKQEFFEISRKLANSLKHADRDANADIEISFIEVDNQIMLATLNALHFGQLSTAQSAFQLWYFSVYAIFLDQLAPVTNRAISIMGNMHDLNRQQQLSHGLSFLLARPPAQSQEDPASAGRS